MLNQEELLKQIAFDEKRGLLPEGWTEKIESKIKFEKCERGLKKDGETF